MLIQKQVFVCGADLQSHPVAYLFHLNADTPRGDPGTADFDSIKLVVADGRSSTADQIADWQAKVPDQVPFLLLCPTVEQTQRLLPRVGSVPSFPCVALMVQGLPDAQGVVSHHLEALTYTISPAAAESDSAPAPEGAELKRPQVDEGKVACACTDFATLSEVMVTPAAANAYYSRVLDAMAHRNRETTTEISPPTGLKYRKTTQHVTSPFLNNYQVKNKSDGAITLSWTIWAFLGQSASGNKQYLIVESAMSLAPGELYNNDSCDRGYGNAYYSASLDPSSGGFVYLKHGPTSGSGSFPYSIDVEISYKSPLGGYQVWSFEDSVSSSAKSWDCGSISSGEKLGSKWFMTTPCNGENIKDTWKDAFNFWGHVGGFTAASSGTLEVAAYSAWYTDTLQSGVVNVAGSTSWTEVRFHGSSCSPGMYWYMNVAWIPWGWQPGFQVDFSGLTPS